MHIKRVVLAPVVVLGTILLMATAAAAQTAPDGNASPDAPVSSVLTVNNTLVLLLTGAIIPLVIGLVTREDNPAWVKVGLAAAVSGLANLFVQQIQDDGTAVLSQEFWVQVAIIFATALGTYANIWKPVAAEKGTTLSSVGSPSFGIIPLSRGGTPPQ